MRQVPHSENRQVIDFAKNPHVWHVAQCGIGRTVVYKNICVPNTRESLLIHFQWSHRASAPQCHMPHTQMAGENNPKMEQEV